ncbi:MAG: hypothetical protein JSU91_00400 [Thermoplasmatales archaeon]|nr:MAG: hypothetical protein JSU91_00400 [Thermoplasmatales archaeon]
MKNKILEVLIFTLLISATFLHVAGLELQKTKNSALRPDIEWEKTYGSSMVDWGRCVQQTSDGGYIITGAYDRNVYSPWWGYIYLLKTDSDGNFEWDQKYGIYQYDNLGNYVQETSDGGYIVAGHTGFTYHIDAYILKTDPLGNYSWIRVLGEFDYADDSLSVQETSDGGYIISGWTGSYSAGSSDAWLIKLNSDGEDEWNKTFGGSMLDTGDSVKETLDGGFVICGRTDSFDSFGNGDAWLIKTDMYGNELWNKSYGGNYLDYGKSVLQTSDGGYVFCGSTYSFGAGNHDAWLVRTDMFGYELWNKTFGGSLWDQANSVVETSDGGYFLTGDYTDPVQGDSEMYLVKTDSDGNEEWSYIIEHESRGVTDSGSYGIQTNDGGFIATGETGEYNLALVDILLVKLEGSNQAPSAPEINGPVNGKTGVSYEYGFVSIDPDGDDIAEYIVDWDDGSRIEIIFGPFASGEEIALNHTWAKQGSYTITAKAKDINGLVGLKGTFDVSIPRGRMFQNILLFRLLGRFIDALFLYFQ